MNINKPLIKDSLVYKDCRRENPPGAQDKITAFALPILSLSPPPMRALGRRVELLEQEVSLGNLERVSLRMLDLSPCSPRILHRSPRLPQKRVAPAFTPSTSLSEDDNVKAKFIEEGSQEEKEFNEKFSFDDNRNLPPTEHPERYKTVTFHHPKSEKKVLFIFPFHDHLSHKTHKHVFGLDNHLKYRLLAWSREHSVKLVYVSDTHQMEDILNEYKEGSLSHLILGSHGTSTSLIFGYHSDDDSHRLTIDYKNSKIFRKVAEGGTIFLDACKTGQEVKEDPNSLNLCEYIHVLAPGKKVYGAKTSFKREHLIFNEAKPWDLRIKKQGDQTVILEDPKDHKIDILTTSYKLEKKR